MKSLFLSAIVAGLAFTMGCNRDHGAFMGHKLGESFAQFVATEHPQTQIPAGLPFTGVIHCFDTQSLGDQCKGSREDFDNAHFTFVGDKLSSIETVGAGGIIGHPRQNWNWNLYLSRLTKEYGKPDKMTATDAVWVRRHYVVHAHLIVRKMPFSRTDEEEQEEHIEVLDRTDFDQAKK